MTICWRKRCILLPSPLSPLGAPPPPRPSGLFDYASTSVKCDSCFNMASKRHQESGAEKRKKKRKRDDANAALAGSMLKFVQGGAQGQEEDLEQPSTSRSSPHQLSTSWSADFATAPSPDQQPSTTSSVYILTGEVYPSREIQRALLLRISLYLTKSLRRTAADQPPPTCSVPRLSSSGGLLHPPCKMSSRYTTTIEVHRSAGRSSQTHTCSSDLLYKDLSVTPLQCAGTSAVHHLPCAPLSNYTIRLLCESHYFQWLINTTEISLACSLVILV
ncbi:uncharacterized protein LOC119008787 isoform X2 [Acanthopagrus latus]|uniref:uncharacterized protein LOC119008787 isoform X2 n=1 Tax=Acanthopagrus latus TaxID=8177 RepID=UPI00187C0BD3|nr:uncharacterized protein LOC119008787 isoform X2 [Acanthopagrus latus]